MLGSKSPNLPVPFGQLRLQSFDLVPAFLRKAQATRSKIHDDRCLPVQFRARTVRVSLSVPRSPVEVRSLAVQVPFGRVRGADVRLFWLPFPEHHIVAAVR